MFRKFYSHVISLYFHYRKKRQRNPVHPTPKRNVCSVDLACSTGSVSGDDRKKKSGQATSGISDKYDLLYSPRPRSSSALSFDLPTDQEPKTGNLVPRVSHPPAQSLALLGGGRMRDPGNEVIKQATVGSNY